MATVELTEDQIKGVLTLLNRVDVKGSEATGVVILQQIFTRALQASPAVPEAGQPNRAARRRAAKESP